MTEQKPWELTDKEILKASQVNTFLPNGELDPDCGYLKGREQVARTAQRKLVEWLEQVGCLEHEEIAHYWGDNCLTCELKRELGIGEGE